MMMLLRLLAPWALCVLDFLLIQWQWRAPLSYPWPFVAIIVSFVVAAMFIGYKRIKFREAAHKMGPIVLFLCAISLASTLVEGLFWQWGVAVGVALSVLLSLKLFFLFCFEPPKYPVNALSHVGLAFVPLTFFFFARGASGLWIFLRTPINTLPLLTLIVIGFGTCGALLYRWTAHPSASRHDRSQWTWFGAFIAMQAALLIILLPFGMDAHGALAAIFLAIPLRMRRYAYKPIPSRRFAWIEGVTATGIVFGILLLTRWA